MIRVDSPPTANEDDTRARARIDPSCRPSRADRASSARASRRMHLPYLARARLASRATTDEGALVSLATMLLAALGVMRRETRDAARDSRSSATHGAFTALAPVWALCAMSARSEWTFAARPRWRRRPGV